MGCVAAPSFKGPAGLIAACGSDYIGSHSTDIRCSGVVTLSIAAQFCGWLIKLTNSRNRP